MARTSLLNMLVAVQVTITFIYTHTKYRLFIMHVFVCLFVRVYQSGLESWNCAGPTNTFEKLMECRVHSHEQTRYII